MPGLLEQQKPLGLLAAPMSVDEWRAELFRLIQQRERQRLLRLMIPGQTQNGAASFVRPPGPATSFVRG